MAQYKALLDWNPGLFSLKGKTAIVTGGNTGLGQGYSTAFALAGAKVFVATEFVDFEETRAILEQTGAEFDFFKADLTKPDEISRIIPTCLERFGSVDVLVNNAGVMRMNSVAEYTDRDWRDIFAVHVDGTFYLGREAAKVLIKQGGGKIINIGSVMTFRGDPLSVGYSACKHAIAGITKSMAADLGRHNIQVNAVAPGFIKTAGNPPGMESFGAKVPCGRLGCPYDLMGLIVFLASPASDYISGSVIVIDGGYTINPL